MPCLFNEGPDFGTNLNFADDDFAEVDFTENFTFSFYGTTYSSVYINSNGNLTFGGPDTAYTPSFDRFINNLPRIAPYWIDLHPSFAGVGGGVFYQQLPDRFIVSYIYLPYYFGAFHPPINTFQVVLYNTGMIGFGYDTLDNTFPAGDADPAFPLVGLASGAGGSSSIFEYNPPENFTPLQTVNGPKGELNQTQLFWIYNGDDYILIDRVVPFHWKVVVPYGYTLDTERSLEVVIDPSRERYLRCATEPIKVPATIPDPCSCGSGSMTCFVSVNAVRGIGEIPLRGLIPIRQLDNDATSYICSNDRVCFNKILCIGCLNSRSFCNDPAFLDNATVQNVTISDPITKTCCGETIYELRGFVKLLPCC